MSNPSIRYGQCDDTCTVDCGHCKGEGPPTVDLDLDLIEEAFAHLASSATSRPYGPLGACPYCARRRAGR